MLMGLPLGPAAGCRAWGNSAAAHEEAYVLKVTDKATDAENLEACLVSYRPLARRRGLEDMELGSSKIDS